MSDKLFLNDAEGNDEQEIKDWIVKEFQIEKELIHDIELLIADVDNGGYDGDAYFLFRQGGKYYEVFGSHCSCYGFEDQWKPEETTLKYMLSDMWPRRNDEEKVNFVKGLK